MQQMTFLCMNAKDFASCSRVIRGMSMMTPVAHADVGNHDRIGWTVLRLQIGVVPWMHFRELIKIVDVFSTELNTNVVISTT